MSKKNIILAVTNGLWLIEENAALQMGHQVAKLLAGEKVFADEDDKAIPEFMIIEAGTESGSYMSDSLKSAKPGSIALINIEGPIMKYDSCGDPGTQTYERMIKEASANPNIEGIILQIDSPGGTVSGTESLANTIGSVTKPVVTLATDLMASAAYWIGSQADHILANTKTTRIGSIGTMLSFMDVQPYYEKMGIKFHDIFADASSEKNASFAAARKGEYQAIKDELLNPMNDQFLAAVKNARGPVPQTALKGKVFVAEEAMQQKLIDGIGTLSDAINKIHELNSNASAKENITLQRSQMKTITLTAAHAALLALFNATIADAQTSVDVELNDENLTKLDAKVKLAEDNATALSESQNKLEAISSELATAKDDLSATKQAFEDFKKENPGSTTSKTEKVDDLGASSDDFTCDVDERVAAARKNAGLV